MPVTVSTRHRIVTAQDMYEFPRLVVPTKAVPNVGPHILDFAAPYYLVGTDDARFWGLRSMAPGMAYERGGLDDAHWFRHRGNALAFGTGRVHVDGVAVLYVVEGLVVQPHLLTKKTDSSPQKKR